MLHGCRASIGAVLQALRPLNHFKRRDAGERRDKRTEQMNRRMRERPSIFTTAQQANRFGGKCRECCERTEKTRYTKKPHFQRQTTARRKILDGDADQITAGEIRDKRS